MHKSKSFSNFAPSITIYCNTKLMEQFRRYNGFIKPLVSLGDLCLLNALFLGLYYHFGYPMAGNESMHSLPQLLAMLNLVYLFCNHYTHGVVLHERIVRPERIVRRVLFNTFMHAGIFISLIALQDGEVPVRFFTTFYTSLFIAHAAYRLLFRYALKQYRKKGGNNRRVIMVGSNDNMLELYREMTNDPTIGFHFLGYFDDAPATQSAGITSPNYLGSVYSTISYLQENPIDIVYCCLPSKRSDEILPIIQYCERHLIRFFSVPNIRTYLHRRMHFQMFGNVPVLSILEEPLSQFENRLAKRVFDIVFSGLFLCTLFPLIYLVVGIAIKLSSPGPILFKQKRSGKDGKEFWCYKFRSMRVNADSDRLQATEHDPRKTKIGEFIRKTSIDELPQFINVFLGQMSVVGPRPHMLKHTEQYSALINQYMIRHLIKPGVTGWAQVNGYRGETKELWQMKGRVERDVWYLEHWTFLLDLYIIYKTVKNGIMGDPQAY